MYRLLIADDEPLEREGLDLTIAKGLPDVFKIDHAENGRIAIELTEKNHYDIIFMDIKMPGIQGLEAVEVIRKKLPHAKIIIVSAYDYFSYAKAAISLGVKEYILKPAKRDHIITLLRNLLSEIEKDHQKRVEELYQIEMLSHFRPLTENELSMMIMLNTIQDLSPNEISNLLDFKLEYGYSKVVKIDYPNRLNDSELKRIYECIKHYMKSENNCIVSPIIDGKIAIFEPIELNRLHLIQEIEIKNAANRLVEYINKQTGFNVHCEVGSIQRGIDGWRKSYFEALYAFNAGMDKVIEAPIASKQIKITNDELLAICSAINMIDLDLSLEQFNRIYDRLTLELNLDTKQLMAEIIILFNHLEQFLKQQNYHLTPFQFPDIDEPGLIKKVTDQQIIKLIQIISKEKETRINHFVEVAKAYIYENYRDDISLVQIANYVNLNPFYFSKMFKKKTGETFSDFMMKVRIEQAKQLMQDERLNLKEISYEVGYKDPNYFSRVFKKYTNESPKHFRNRLINR
jgi:two-component system, response regulator YesN